MSSFIFISLWYSYARGSVPFLMMFAGGYLLCRLHVALRAVQDAAGSRSGPGRTRMPDLDVEAEVPFA